MSVRSSAGDARRDPGRHGAARRLEACHDACHDACCSSSFRAAGVLRGGPGRRLPLFGAARRVRGAARVRRQAARSWYEAARSWYEAARSWYEAARSWYEAARSWYEAARGRRGGRAAPRAGAARGCAVRRPGPLPTVAPTRVPTVHSPPPSSFCAAPHVSPFTAGSPTRLPRAQNSARAA
jgi:hypothetical protein